MRMHSRVGASLLAMGHSFQLDNEFRLMKIRPPNFH